MDTYEGNWYNISERIPMTPEDIHLASEGDIGGVYYGWEEHECPKYWVVRRGEYRPDLDWDYMDILAIKEDGAIVNSYVVRCGSNHKVITESRFNNLVAKLKDPNHDIMKIKRSYL